MDFKTAAKAARAVINQYKSRENTNHFVHTMDLIHVGQDFYQGIKRAAQGQPEGEPSTSSARRC